MAAYEPEQWSDLFVASAGAGAVRAGLDCSETSRVKFRDVRVTAVALSGN